MFLKSPAVRHIRPGDNEPWAPISIALNATHTEADVTPVLIEFICQIFAAIRAFRLQPAGDFRGHLRVQPLDSTIVDGQAQDLAAR